LQASEPTIREAIAARLEAIVDPCSAAANLPAGLVSMGLVREISVDERSDGVHARVTLCITEPGCMMGAIFQVNVKQALEALPEIVDAEVEVDYGYVWGPDDLEPEYRRRLAETRRRRMEHMRTVAILPTRRDGVS
jgi:metal-sulfur cluster biosynthetic enzyme